MLKEVLINKLGFKILVSETSLFINKSIGIIICIYINDLAIINPIKEIYNSFIKNIKKYFKLKELGLIKDYLDVKIDYKPEKKYIKLYIAKYINKLLNKFKFNNLNLVFIPIETKIKLEFNPKQVNVENINYYQQLIGSLLFLVLTIRADIYFVVIKLARFASNFNNIYFLTIKQIFRYLKNIAYLGIVYSKGNLNYI